ncbi:DNA cytosine methyltransferase [Mesorhizobium sp. M1A.F.Ca.IN.022.02.1.1]|uniref:DNA cytosine methyltransferase n=1 Tax=Mesorhizobium sp. M1A.F.Ca.IN.022.02.1.1 TaxID=2496766 RepID=UPI0019D07BD1|nr:DNA cytosine methyltransferase [Mesorhizobium sp. M1A.F.Ca.IN.022.02.1.1]
MKPIAIDLFCCAGGATKGLQRAGFYVIGVDIEPQPNYCGDEFYQADALTFPLDGADFIWASPPCQGYTSLRHAPGTVGAPKLIHHVRHRMPKDVLWVIENVEDAKREMRDPVLLCGSMFGLDAQGCRLQRHRLFESNFIIMPLECSHDKRPVIGVYGGHARKRAKSAGGRGTRDSWDGGHKDAASEALGINWMTLAEMSEAIPPAYSEYIGHAALWNLEIKRGIALQEAAE